MAPAAKLRKKGVALVRGKRLLTNATTPISETTLTAKAATSP